MTQTLLDAPLRGNERHFFLQTVDGVSAVALSEVYCGISSFEDISCLLDIPIEDLNPSSVPFITLDDTKIISQKFGVTLHAGPEDEFQLDSWSPADGLSYRLHSGRELILMLAGQKPLSYFSDIAPLGGASDIPRHLFDPYVEEGRFVRREYCEPVGAETSKIRGLELCLYALAREEWRIEAYILLRNVAKKTGWTEALTRMEGSLLGYSDQQNESFIQWSTSRSPLGNSGKLR